MIKGSKILLRYDHNSTNLAQKKKKKQKMTVAKSLGFKPVFNARLFFV